MSVNCKVKVYHGNSYHPLSCKKNATRDGYCGVHHPDTVKARREKSLREFDTKMRHHDAALTSAREAQRKGGEYDAVAAERDRYRAALSEIAGYYESTTGVHVDILIDIAREALEVTP